MTTTLGILAAAALLVVMVYSARRARPDAGRLGPVKAYLRVHVWGGIVFLVLFLLHAGPRPPAGWLNLTVWTLSLWVVATGIAGHLFQRLAPPVLRRIASFEVHMHRVPELTAELRARAERAVAGAPPGVRDFYRRVLAPELAAPRLAPAILLAGAAGRPDPEPALLRRTLDAEGTATLDELTRLRTAKRELDAHYTTQWLLRAWLWLHLPAAVALLALVALHILSVLYY